MRTKQVGQALRPIVAGAALLVALAAAPAHAEAPVSDPARLAAAERLTADRNSDGISNGMLKVMRGMMVELITSHGKSAAEAGNIVDAVIMPAMRAHLPELRRQIVQFWAGAMTTTELQTADAFYRSPTGRKMIVLQTQALPVFAALGHAWGQQVARDVLVKQRDALRQRGVEL